MKTKFQSFLFERWKKSSDCLIFFFFFLKENQNWVATQLSFFPMHMKMSWHLIFLYKKTSIFFFAWALKIIERSFDSHVLLRKGIFFPEKKIFKFFFPLKQSRKLVATWFYSFQRNMKIKQPLDFSLPKQISNLFLLKQSKELGGHLILLILKELKNQMIV